MVDSTSFLTLLFSWSWLLNVASSPSISRASYLLHKDTFMTWGGFFLLLWPEMRVQSPLSWESVKSVSSVLEAKLSAACKDFRQDCHSAGVSDLFWLSVMHHLLLRSLDRPWLVSSSYRMAACSKKLIQLGTRVPTIPRFIGKVLLLKRQ